MHHSRSNGDRDTIPKYARRELSAPAETSEGGRVPSPKELLEAIRRRIWVILVTGFVLTAATVGVSFLQKPTYEAYVTVLIAQASESSNADTSLSSQSTGLQLITQTMTEAVNSRLIAEAVISRLGLEITPEDFQKNLTAKQIRATQFIQINYRDTSPERAQQVASAIGNELSEQVSEVNPLASDVTATVWGQAWVSDEPVSPKPVRNGLGALGAGLMLGVALAFLLQYLYPKQRSRDEVEPPSDMSPKVGTVKNATARHKRWG
jgi:capsular polysaccharide biosynthesis protein